MKNFKFGILAALIGSAVGQARTVVVKTTSGLLQGIEENEVMSFKGVRYGQAADGALRWEPPVPFTSAEPVNADSLGPSCVQSFEYGFASIYELTYNTPPPASESEDCLFLNIWAPSSTAGVSKPVVFWIHGGAFSWGTASVPRYDGASIAANQDIVVVTINYRTNVFGFPSAPEFTARSNNLGILDQELALQWVQTNIKQFGGDPQKVTIMGHSSGSASVAYAMSHYSQDAPFRAAIMLSGAPVSTSPIPSFTSFNGLAEALNCDQTPGPSRIQCLKKVPADVIKNFTTGPSGGFFGPVVDNISIFDDPLSRVRAGKIARIPLLIGNMQNDGTLFTIGETNLSTALENIPSPGASASPASVRSAYPGLNDTQIIPEAWKDAVIHCPAKLWSSAVIQSGIFNVFRYSYGAVFADLQLFPGAGAWHGSELPELFGTFNTSTATPAEVTLSHSFQTTFANFIKDPDTYPAPHWVKYTPGNATDTLAKLAYVGNVELDNFVQLVQSDALDGPCDALWDSLLDFRP